ncbi:alpha/beta hydrolase [Salinibacterium sp. ZJ454]|uniref:alpha/beta fold hydrolase n=1 Tax=Salinibacterium sp. ZJ454 TaxID=2708339 RepID=UPI00141F8E0B|nr:alpha/beta hydrolase [Salinibacterium sp. ZJ454]
MTGQLVVRLGNGLRIPYLEQGDRGRAPPVLLLHAWGDSPEFWRPLLDRLPPAVHVLVPAGRGHGGADAPAHGYTVADFAEDVVLFLDAIEAVDPVVPARAVLVGHSSAGLVARAVAATHPERVAGLVLIGSPYSLHGRRPAFLDALEQLQDPISPDALAPILDEFPAPPSLPAAVRDAVARDARATPARVWKQTFAGLTSAPPPAPPRHPPPTLVLHGADDAFLDPSDAEALRRDLSGELVIVDGAGHIVLWDDPSRVAHELLRFLSRIRPATTNYH